ncbi:MAG: AraC family transcriptional regulator [Chitinophagaceae bacterium]
MEPMREITPLTNSDCFTFFSRTKEKFNFPLHYHEEYELNLILHASGAQRIVGDHIGLISDYELVFLGPDLPHTWNNHKCESKSIRETTIQFHKDMLDDTLLRRNQLSQIRGMFLLANQGIAYSEATIKKILPAILSLTEKTGFDSFLELLSILHDLSIARDKKILSSHTPNNSLNNYNSRRIEAVNNYLNKNYNKEVTLNDVAKLANMPDASFSRFIKKHTGRTFVDTLNETRLGYATRLLIETTQTISEIAYSCGFNNVTYFNRIFKKKKHCTPKEFRDNFSETRIFI